MPRHICLCFQQQETDFKPKMFLRPHVKVQLLLKIIITASHFNKKNLTPTQVCDSRAFRSVALLNKILLCITSTRSCKTGSS